MGRAALILVVGFGISFGTIKHNLNKQASTAVDVGVEGYERAVARNAANSMVGIARRELFEDNDWRPGSVAEADNALFAPVTDIMGDNGSYSLSYDDHNTDSTLADDLVRLSGVTTFGAGTREVEVVMRRRYVMPPIPSAVNIDAPATFAFTGAAFRIDGSDTPVDGKPGDGTGDPMPGIGVVDAASSANAGAALDANQKKCVAGTGASPSIEVVPDTLDLDETVERLVRHADRVIPAGEDAGADIAWGTLENPEITLALGDLSISGSGHGAGVLLVQGSLSLSGNFDWYGPIILMGDNVGVTINVVGNSAIYGALVVQGNTADFNIAGNIKIYYSTEALQGNIGKLNLHDYSIVSWWQ